LIEKEKLQHFRLLIKKGEHDRALVFAQELFGEYMAKEKIEEAAQALIFIEYLLEGTPNARLIDKAAKELRALAVQQRNFGPYARFLHARVERLLDIGDLEVVASIMKEMKRIGWTGLARLTRAEMAIIKGELRMALELLEDYPPKDATSILARAETLAGMGKYEEAIRIMESDLLAPQVFGVLKKSITGFCLISMGEHARAYETLNKAMEQVMQAHGGYIENIYLPMLLSVFWAVSGDHEKSALYLNLAEIAAVHERRTRRILEIRALRETIFSEGLDSLQRAKDIRQTARQKGFGAAEIWSLWAIIKAANEAGIDQEWQVAVGDLFKLAKENNLWGYIAFIAQVVPRPLELLLSVYPDNVELKDIEKRLRIHTRHGLVKVLLLGKPAIKTSEGIFPLKKDRAGELLVFFALHTKSELTREMIIREFWPDLPPHRARRNFYKFISIARNFLKRHGVRLKPHKLHDSAWIGCGLQTDLDQLVSLVNTARAIEASPVSQEAMSVYEKAMALIRGDFLEGWQTGLFEDAREEARGLAELVYTRMAEYLVDTEPEKAFDLSRKALNINPFSEEACELAISVLLRLGKHEKAKELYDNFVKRFRAELKMVPRLTWPPRRGDK